MVYTAENDPLCYPGTSVLINLLDIEDAAELEEAELALFLLRADEALPAGALDVPHYLALHRHLFQDVYAWAGEIRKIRIGKGNTWFAYPEYIQTWLDGAFAEYGDPDALTDASPEEFAGKTAHLLAEINAAHPFREGNGRTQLTFLHLLAANAGYVVNDDVLEPERVMAAMIESFNGSEEPLKALVLDFIS